MSATDALTDLRMARERIDEALALYDLDGAIPLTNRRTDLDDARRHVDAALAHVEKAISG